MNMNNANWPGYNIPQQPKKSRWPLFLAVGCGILAVIGVLLFVLAVFMFSEKPDETKELINELKLDDAPTAIDLTNADIEEMIHIGMPKDSVLMTFGNPTTYRFTSWADDVLYQYNDTTYLMVYFENNKVSDYEYHNSSEE